MADHLYLRPCGFLYGSDAGPGVEGGRARWLAGGPIAFTSVELIEGTPAGAVRSFHDIEDLAQSRAAEVGSLIDRITEPRRTLAGLHFDRSHIMGVVNVTPDSFSDGGLHGTSEAAIAHAARLAQEGADILDIGGESTRPGADAVEAAQESERIVPVIEGLHGTKAVI